MLIGFHVCFPNCSFFVALLTVAGSTVPPLAVHVPLSTPGAIKMQKQSRLVMFKEFHIMQSSLSECFFAVFFVCFNNKHIIQLVNEAVKSWLVLLASLHSKQAWIKTTLLIIESKRQIIPEIYLNSTVCNVEPVLSGLSHVSDSWPRLLKWKWHLSG